MQLITAGDDYELCFTAPVDAVEGCCKIGKIVGGSGIKLDGTLVAAKGFEH
jgi:thiamine monophosphate kinase